MIRLLLTTGLYIRAFEDWDQLAELAKTWIELRRMIQEAFQCRLATKDMPPPFHSSRMHLVLLPPTIRMTTPPKRLRLRWRPAHGNYGCQLVPENGPVPPNTGPSTRSTPSKSASNDGADGSSFVQPERRWMRHRAPRPWSTYTNGPICPKRIRTQHLWGPWWTGARTWARSRPWPTCIFCRTCTPHHASYGRKGTVEDIMRLRPRRSSPPLLEPHETICKLECVLFLWF